MNTNTTPAIKKHQPAPTKAEIIEALAIRLVETRRKAYAAHQVTRAAAKTKLDALILAHVLASPNLPKEINTGWGNPVRGVCVTIKVDNVTSEINRASDAMNKLTCEGVPSIEQARKFIRASLAGVVPNHVAAMLKDDAMVAGFDKMLNVLLKPHQAALTA